MRVDMLTNDNTTVIISLTIVKLPSVARVTLGVFIEFVMTTSVGPVAKQLPTGVIEPLASFVWCFAMVSLDGGQQQIMLSHRFKAYSKVPIQSELPRRIMSD